MRAIAELVATLVRVRLLQRRFPFFVGWNLTFRCNLDCAYCGTAAARGAELDTREVLEGLDALWRLGARWVTFGGGEPLLRNDIGEILQHARQKGYRTFLSTNGLLLPRKANEVRGIHHVNLSLDGREDAHDSVRGRGAYAATIEGIEFCKIEGIPVSLQCTLSAINLASVEDVANIAEQYHVPVMYQPATQWLDSSTESNPIAPPVAEYRAAIQKVVELKKRGKPIRNSFTGLRHLACWPDPTGIWCGAGQLMCEVEPDGTLLACHQAQVGMFLRGEITRQDSLGERWEQIAAPAKCRQCWCAPVVELALLFSLRLEAVYNAVRTM